jgi:3-oxoacyl-[acyl-carrier-protein] synthase III
VRYGRAEGERPFELATEAGVKALARAGLEPADIDLLIYVGVGRGFLEPATANVFQDLLGLRNATCFDVLDACASWLRALHMAHSFLATGAYRRILVLNAEFNGNLESYEFKTVDEIDYRFPAYTIGEAATATILENSGSQPDCDDQAVIEFRSFGDQRATCLIPLPNWRDYLAVEGPELEPMRFISHGQKIMEFGLDRMVDQYNDDPAWKAFDPELVFFHAASDGMARAGMQRCGLDEARGYYTHHRFANTVSASVPLAMEAALDEGRLADGTRVLIAIASAGIVTALSRFIFRG